MIVYKVVHRYKTNILTSYAAEGQSEVKYEPGEFAKAPEWLAEKGYHLLVFDHLDAALDFSPKAEVWRAEAEEEMELPKRLTFASLFGGFIKTYEDNWPKGTHMYKRVKLLEKVHDRHSL